MRIILALGLVISVGNQSFAFEDRVDANFSLPDGKFMGRVESSDIGTGTLVGPREVLTVGHLLPPKFIGDDQSGNLGVFKLNYSFGSYTAISRIVGILRQRGPTGTASRDGWAIAILEQPLGLIYGWNDVSPNYPPLGTPVTTGGYYGDWHSAESPGIERNCTTRAMNPVESYNVSNYLDGLSLVLPTNCWAARGQSGGPVIAFENRQGFGLIPFVVGVFIANTGLPVPSRTSVAIASSQFYQNWLAINVTDFLTELPRLRAQTKVFIPSRSEEAIRFIQALPQEKRSMAILSSFPTVPALQAAYYDLKGTYSKTVAAARETAE